MHTVRRAAVASAAALAILATPLIASPAQAATSTSVTVTSKVASGQGVVRGTFSWHNEEKATFKGHVAARCRTGIHPTVGSVKMKHTAGTKTIALPRNFGKCGRKVPFSMTLDPIARFDLHNVSVTICRANSIGLPVRSTCRTKTFDNPLHG